MNETLLIVEDEDKIRDIIVDFLNASGYATLEASNGLQALKIYEENKVDLIILDIMMPEIDGWAVCRRIRKKSDVPIIILTARAEEDDKLLGFELGADEYVIKPFSPLVLVARVKAMLRRIEKTENKTSDINVSGIEINEEAFSVKVDGEKIEMTPKEFKLLLYLIKNEGKVLTREQILTKVWGYDFYGENRVVDSHIKKLRKKLQSKSSYIHTVIRIGYKFEVTR